MLRDDPHLGCQVELVFILKIYVDHELLVHQILFLLWLLDAVGMSDYLLGESHHHIERQFIDRLDASHALEDVASVVDLGFVSRHDRVRDQVFLYVQGINLVDVILFVF